MATGRVQLRRLYRSVHVPALHSLFLRGRFSLRLAPLVLLLGGLAHANVDTLSLTAAPAVPLEQATDLKSQPLAVLAKFPDAGPAMARFVARAIARQPGIVDAILSIVPDASPQQASAIGAGMVRGVRTIEAKQPATARVISEKIMKSSNTWLRTTFAALGPHYAPTEAGASMMASIMPTPSQPMEVGSELPVEKSRIGPTHQGDMIGQNEWVDEDKCPFVSIGYDYTSCRGTIVAVVVSNASSNGAVSTSPTQ